MALAHLLYAPGMPALREPVQPVGLVVQSIDWALRPVMRFVSGVPDEAPQRTHRWNNTKLDPVQVEECLDWINVVCREGDPNAIPRMPGSFRFHLPRFGGWNKYVVMQPEVYSDAGMLWYQGPWHVGWLTDTSAGVSRLTLEGPVRMLIGPEKVWFFGIEGKGGSKQMRLKFKGEGVIGDGSEFKNIPLL